MRTGQAPAFGAQEIELAASLSEPLADAVREHVRGPAPPRARAAGRDAGLMLFAPDGELISANEGAHALLDELPSAERGNGHRRAAGIPLPAAGALARARGIAEERDHGPARVLTRSRSGRWLACEGSCLQHADGRLLNTALLISSPPGRPRSPRS